MFSLEKIQEKLKEFGFDGWLLYDFRFCNPLARRVLGLSEKLFLSRRWFYFIPASGDPVKINHKIEPAALASYPGISKIYLRWQELESSLKTVLTGKKRIAMEYSPNNAIPYLSRVDAGTIEFIKTLGVDVVSSGDLIQVFESCLNQKQFQNHLDAAVHTREAYEVVFRFIAESIRKKIEIKESDVIRIIMEHFSRNNLFTDHAPIVGVNSHSGDPHYSTSSETDRKIQEGDFILVDLWAKLNDPEGIYSDLTRTGFVGTAVPEKYTKIFDIVSRARDAAIEKVTKAFADGTPIEGWEIDNVTREVIVKAGYGEYFCHRTGHSIGKETHGNGANIDGLETLDTRKILPGSLFSIEPGIYLEEFGVRSEVNVFVDWDKKIQVTGGKPQTCIVPILKDY